MWIARHLLLRKVLISRSLSCSTCPRYEVYGSNRSEEVQDLYEREVVFVPTALLLAREDTLTLSSKPRLVSIERSLGKL